ncbi:MAG: DUF3459 domain-containing protein [Pseudolabrys sp.]
MAASGAIFPELQCRSSSGTDNGSILTLYRRLLSVRRDHAALSSGAFRLIGVQGNALVYERADERERIVICRNFGDGAQQVSVDDVDGASILVSTYPARTYLVRARMKA